MPLSKQDRQKLLNAGYTLIRGHMEGSREDRRYRIKHLTKNARDWTTLHAGFKSQAEMFRKMTELLKISTIIED